MSNKYREELFEEDILTRLNKKELLEYFDTGVCPRIKRRRELKVKYGYKLRRNNKESSSET